MEKTKMKTHRPVRAYAAGAALLVSMALVLSSTGKCQAQQMIDDSSGNAFMEEVMPAKPPKPKPVVKPGNALETLPVPVNPKGHIVPLLTPGGGPVMPFMNKIETGVQPIFGYGGYYPFPAAYPVGVGPMAPGAAGMGYPYGMPYGSPLAMPYGGGLGLGLGPGGYGGGLGLGLGLGGYGGGLGLGLGLGGLSPYGYGNGPVGIFSPLTPFGAVYPGGFGLPYYSSTPFNIPLGRAGAVGGNLIAPMIFPNVSSSYQSSVTTFGGIAPASSDSDPDSLLEAASQLPGKTYTTSGSSSMRWLPGLLGGRASYSGSGLLGPLMGQ